MNKISINKAISTSSIPSIQWIYTWGGNGDDDGSGITVDEAGNAYVAGGTDSFGAGDYDMCLVKFNSMGVQWNSIWGGINMDWGLDLALDALGNVYVCGLTESFGPVYSDLCLVKFNPTGVVEWNYTWGGNGRDQGNGIAIDSSGNAYVGGYTYSYGGSGNDMCLVKFNPTGGVEWNYTWGGSGDDEGNEMVLDAAGNAYVAGYTDSFGAGGHDMCLVKFNATGVEWNYTWGGSGDDGGNDVAVDAAGNAYVAGHTDSFGAGGYDMCLVKFSSAGVEWNYTWGTSDSDGGSGVALDASSNAYVVGSTYRIGTGPDMCLVKFSSAGVEWNYTWGGNSYDVGLDIVLDASENAYVTGYTGSLGAGGSDIYVIKFRIGTSEDGTQVPDPLLFLILGGIIGGIAGGSGIVAILVLGIIRPRRKRSRAVHAN